MNEEVERSKTEENKQISIIDMITEKYVMTDDELQENPFVSIMYLPMPHLPKLIVLINKSINCVGDSEQLKKICKNCVQLDLACNDICRWEDVYKLLNCLPNLLSLNLSANRLPKMVCGCEEKIERSFLDSNSSPKTTSSSSSSPSSNESSPRTRSRQLDHVMKGNDSYRLKKVEDVLEDELLLSPLHIPSFNANIRLRELVLNSCFVPLSTIELVVSHLPSLIDLHLSLNGYRQVTFDNEFVHNNIQCLYFTDNPIERVEDVLRLGKAFPNLRQLCIANVNVGSYGLCGQEYEEGRKIFENVESLSLSNTPIYDFNELDNIRLLFPFCQRFFMLKLPIFKNMEPEEYWIEAIPRLYKPNLPLNINGTLYDEGSIIDNQRAFVRKYKYVEEKPNLYYDLTSIFGNVPDLVDIRFDKSEMVTFSIRIGFIDDFSNVPDVKDLDNFLEITRPCQINNLWTIFEFRANELLPMCNLYLMNKGYLGIMSESLKLYYLDEQTYKLGLHRNEIEVNQLKNRTISSLFFTNYSLAVVVRLPLKLDVSPTTRSNKTNMVWSATDVLESPRAEIKAMKIPEAIYEMENIPFPLNEETSLNILKKQSNSEEHSSRSKSVDVRRKGLPSDLSANNFKENLNTQLNSSQKNLKKKRCCRQLDFS